MIFPKPDRSNYSPNIQKTACNPTVDLGFAEGEFSDGRPYRVECWAEDQATYLTFFFSSIGLAEVQNSFFKELFAKEGLISPKNEEVFIQGVLMRDASEHPMWSVTAVLGDDEKSFLKCEIDLRRY